MSAGPTRAEMQATITQLTQDRDRWRDLNNPDKETAAISSCIKALTPIKSLHSSPSTNYGRNDDDASIRRILFYLANRFGVSLQ